eukprot:scaffold237481_cov63-Attheya_sp.AAC.2
MPWEDGTRAYLEVTGIPPHTLLVCGQEEVKAMIKKIVPSMQKELDDWTMNGVLSKTRMRKNLEEVQFLFGMLDTEDC